MVEHSAPIPNRGLVVLNATMMANAVLADLKAPVWAHGQNSHRYLSYIYICMYVRVIVVHVYIYIYIYMYMYVPHSPK